MEFMGDGCDAPIFGLRIDSVLNVGQQIGQNHVFRESKLLLDYYYYSEIIQGLFTLFSYGDNCAGVMAGTPTRPGDGLFPDF